VKTNLVAALFVAFTVAVPFAQQRPESQAIEGFNAATSDYVAMHRRLEKLVGPITLNSSVESINRSIQGLAAAVRVERAQAQQGDLFTPPVAAELRARVNTALLEHGFTAADVIASQLVEGVDPRDAHLRVNDTFPWILASAMFPCVIAALPPLPPELQYRIVGEDLLLIDVHASLVVDILPQVLPGLTIWDRESARVRQ
jgi:hypothetical protein